LVTLLGPHARKNLLRFAQMAPARTKTFYAKKELVIYERPKNDGKIITRLAMGDSMEVVQFSICKDFAHVVSVSRGKNDSNHTLLLNGWLHAREGANGEKFITVKQPSAAPVIVEPVAAPPSKPVRTKTFWAKVPLVVYETHRMEKQAITFVKGDPMEVCEFSPSGEFAHILSPVEGWFRARILNGERFISSKLVPKDPPVPKDQVFPTLIVNGVPRGTSAAQLAHVCTVPGYVPDKVNVFEVDFASCYGEIIFESHEKASAMMNLGFRLNGKTLPVTWSDKYTAYHATTL